MTYFLNTFLDSAPPPQYYLYLFHTLPDVMKREANFSNQ